MLLRSVERACIGGVQAFEDEDEVELVEAEVDHEVEDELVEATAKVAETVVKMPCLSRNSFRKKETPSPYPQRANAVLRKDPSNRRTNHAYK